MKEANGMQIKKAELNQLNEIETLNPSAEKGNGKNSLSNFAKSIPLPKFNGASRTVTAKKNIFLLFIFNGFNFIFNFILVRLTFDYLGQTNYGVWVTLASVFTWFGYLDFGLGNGLRNKLAEAFAKDEYELARIYVSTTYAIFSVIIIFFYAVFLVINTSINWTVVFNASPNLQNELSTLVIFVFTFFMLNFVLKLVTFINSADQKPALNGFFLFVINLFTLIMVYLLIKTTSSSILLLGAGTTLMPILIFFAGSVVLFRKKYRRLAPSIKYVNLKYSGQLIGKGFQFFILQAAGLILFTTGNMIITQIYGPEDVAVYNVAYKYFNYIPIFFAIILNPLWSAYTDAYVKEDFNWIQKTIKKTIKIWGGLSVAVIVMIFAANYIYSLWIGPNLQVPFMLTIFMGIYAIVTNWNDIFIFFLNGVGKIRISLYFSVFIGIVNIPLSIFLAKYLGMGISGVITSTILCLLLGAVYAPIQYYKIIHKKDKGVWGK